MPNYATHQKINACVLFLVNASALMWYKTAVPFDFVVFTVAFILSSWILTPDLDTKSTPYYRGKGAKVVWSAFQKLSKHRGILHNPVLSPIILCTPIMILQWELDVTLDLSGIYAGILIQVWSHIITDWIGSSKKRKED